MTTGLILLAFAAAHAANPTNANQRPSPAEWRAQETELRNQLSGNPDDAAAHLKLGQLYIDAANFPAAVDQARAAQRDTNYRDDADALLARALFLGNQFDQVLVAVQPADRKPQAESQVRMSLGLALLNTAGVAQAKPLLEDAVRLDPASWRAHVALARVLILRRQLAAARTEIEAAQALVPDEVGVIRIAAELDRAAGDPNGAITKLSEVLKIHPTSVPALAGRADARISLDKLHDAQNDLNAAWQLVRNPQVVYLDALIFARNDKPQEAKRLLESINSVFTRMPIGYYLYGVLNYRVGQPETAEYNLAKFQARQPNVSGVALVRAEIALKRNDPAGAIEMLKPLIAVNPADTSVAMMLARAYVSNSQPDQALEMYRTLAATPPSNGPVTVDIEHLMMIYGDAYGDLTEIEKVIMHKAPDLVPPMEALRQGGIDRASEMAEALAKAKPDDPWIQNLLGSVRLAQKRLPEAEAIFRHILDKQPKFTTVVFSLVQTLVAEQRTEEARAMLEGLAGHESDDDLI